MTVLFKLYFYYELCLNDDKIDDCKHNIEIKKCIIEKEYKQIVDIIKKKFSDKITIIEGYKQNVISLISNLDISLTKEEIMEKIKNLGIENKIINLMNFLHKEIEKIKLDFYFFCIKEISELLKIGSFQEVLETISSSFNEKFNSSLAITGTIIGGVFLVSTFGISVATTELGLTVGLLGATYSGFGLLFIVPIFINEIYQKYKSNEKKINDYFENVCSQIIKIQDKYIKVIENKKKDFFDNLVNTCNISPKEIQLLKKAGFQQNFENFIKIFKRP